MKRRCRHFPGLLSPGGRARIRRLRPPPASAQPRASQRREAGAGSPRPAGREPPAERRGPPPAPPGEQPAAAARRRGGSRAGRTAPAGRTGGCRRAAGMAEAGGGAAAVAAGGGGPQQGSPAAGGVAAAATGGPARSAAESPGGPGSARTAGKKAQLRAAPRAKKLEKLGVYSACKVPGRERPPAHGGWGLTEGRGGGGGSAGPGRAGPGREGGGAAVSPALPAETAVPRVPLLPEPPDRHRPPHLGNGGVQPPPSGKLRPRRHVAPGRGPALRCALPRPPAPPGVDRCRPALPSAPRPSLHLQPASGRGGAATCLLSAGAERGRRCAAPGLCDSGGGIGLCAVELRAGLSAGRAGAVRAIPGCTAS